MNYKDRLQKFYTRGEEIFHGITHGIGAGLSIAGMTLLVVLAVLFGNVYHVVSFAIYGTSLVVLYLASTFYHSFQVPRLKRVFQIIDHSSIYLLIAGTYTPFLLVGLRNTFGWIMFGLVWVLALIGIGFEALFIDRYKKLSLLAYVLLGWLSVVILKPLLANVPFSGIIWLGVGGVFYTVGIIFYALKKPYMHAVWHLFVMAGSICHFFAVLLSLAPDPV